MALHEVHILDSTFITHNVKRFTVEKPKGYSYNPGQAVRIALNKQGWDGQQREFNFTSLTSSKTLEFIIKIYDERKGVTHQLGLAHAGDGLLMGEPFGAMSYHGPGYFFAAGSGVTPFIAILRDLQKRKQLEGNTLICTNQTASDVILDEELTKMLGRNFLNMFTRQHVIGFQERRMDRNTVVTLVQNFDQKFYICGPDSFVSNIGGILRSLGAKAESIIMEE
ncbi:MAG: flavodoxin reductase [Bacteroidetes bacterium]|nr:flavodoxin reductase [Bacteroidota bacterium]